MGKRLEHTKNSKIVKVTCIETAGWKEDEPVKAGHNQENGWFIWEGQD